MWIMLNDSFFSIVSKDCGRDELMVRARRAGDIEKLFPHAVVIEFAGTDYSYRAPVKRSLIKAALSIEVDRVAYSNFKSSVQDMPLHNAYMRVWSAMLTVQPRGPRPSHELFDFDFGETSSVEKSTKRRRPAKNTKGR